MNTKLTQKLTSARLSLALGCMFLFLAFLLQMGAVRSSQETLASRIAPYVLRFHILANSDSAQDQTVKLEVRSLILDYMEKQLDPAANKADTIRWIAQQKQTLEELSNRYLNEHGFSYGSRLQLTRCYFPARAYGAFTFPCGVYDAARITLGDGKGHNWWCVLYPRFCFLDAACAQVPEESAALMQETLNQGDFLALEEHRPDIKIRFQWLSFFNPR